MKLTKEQKANEETVQSVDVELNEEQLEVVAGGTTYPDFSDIIDKLKNRPIPD